jgi:hypothetical protein
LRITWKGLAVRKLVPEDHPKQIIKLAGLNLKENTSGKHNGQTKITKRGRKRLRALLFRVIMPLVAKNRAFKALHEYYTKRPDNPLDLGGLTSMRDVAIHKCIHTLPK